MESDFDRLLRCLADRTRRALLDRLRDQPGLTLSELHAGSAHSRQALSKHLALLEDAELVVPVWRGREKLHYLNPLPLQALPARWVTASAQEDAAALQELRAALPPPGAGSGGAAHGAPAAATAASPIAALLLQAPSPRLQGQPVLQADALHAACDYLAGTASAVQALLGAMSPRQGYERPPGGGFSLVEHLWHLADIEALGWLPRMQRILSGPGAVLPGVDGDRLALEHRYQQRPWRAAARRFVADRRRTLAVLASWDPDVLRRSVHFAGSRTRAGGVLAAAVAHDLDHRPAMAALWQDLQATASPTSPTSPTSSISPPHPTSPRSTR